MNKLDSFFDTYEKRICWIDLFYLLSSLTLASIHFYLGVRLFSVNNYQELTQLLDIPWLSSLMIGRLAISLLAMPVLNIFAMVLNLCHLQTVEFVFLIGTLLFVFNKTNSTLEIKIKKHALMQIVAYFILFLIFIFGFAFGFQAGSVGDVIMIVKTLGVFCCVIALILAAIALFKAAYLIGFTLPLALETSVEVIEK